MLNFTLPADPQRLMTELINYHKSYLKPRYDRLMDYYLAKHDIGNRLIEDGKPNNKCVNSYPAYIINTVQGYLLGIPAKYTSQDQAYIDSLQPILYANNEEDENMELLKAMSIMGEAFELVYLDEQAQVCFAQLPNNQTIAIYNDSIKPKLQLVLRYYETGTINQSGRAITHVELYWPDRTDYYTQSGATFVLDDSVPHYFGQVPVIHYLNNNEGTGDFEKILSLINDYDKILSDNSNELEYFRNAYMVIKGFGNIEEEDLRKMRKTGAFLLPGTGENEDVSFITKDLDDSAIMSHLDTLEKNIHKFSNIPNLTDENFASNASGISLRYKLWGFEQLIGAKERKFSNALFNRLQLITTALNLKGKQYDWQEITIKLSRNLPANVLEQSEIIANLKDVIGLIPLEELFGLLPFIEDPQAAAEEARSKLTNTTITPAA